MKIRNGYSGSGSHVGMFGRQLMLRSEEDDKGAAADKAMEEKINKIVHSALSERDKRLEAKINKSIETLVGSKFDEIKQLLVSDDEDDDDTTPGQNDKKGKEGDGLSPEIRAQLKKMEADAKEAKEKADKWEKQANEERMAKLKTEERTNLTQLLSGHVKPALLDMVVAQLHSNVVRDEEDSTKILFKGSDGKLLPLKDGVDSWKKSDAGKEVAPPRDVRGSGGTGGSGASRDPKNFGMEDLGAIIAGSLK